MDTRRALLVDAFTADPFAGAPAGVVPDATGLSDAQMRTIARELSADETAFVLPSGTVDRRIRAFASTGETDRWGRAVVASYVHLLADGAVETGIETTETAAGAVEVETTADGFVWAAQAQPTVEAVDLPLDRVSAALGVPTAALADVADDLPLAVASTGVPVLVVGLDFLEHLGQADPNPERIHELVDEAGADGLYAFTFDTLDRASTLHGRFFAPGGDEAPVSAAASGSCGAYLRHVEAFDSLPETMRFEGGHFVDRPGVVHVRVGETVRVGGRGVASFDGSMLVPRVDDDEIIEA